MCAKAKVTHKEKKEQMKSFKTIELNLKKNKKKNK
jgi:hypothetical protein